MRIDTERIPRPGPSGHGPAPCWTMLADSAFLVPGAGISAAPCRASAWEDARLPEAATVAGCSLCDAAPGSSRVSLVAQRLPAPFAVVRSLGPKRALTIQKPGDTRSVSSATDRDGVRACAIGPIVPEPYSLARGRTLLAVRCTYVKDAGRSDCPHPSGGPGYSQGGLVP